MSLLFPENIILWISSEAVSFFKQPTRHSPQTECLLSVPFDRHLPEQSILNALDQFKVVHSEICQYKIIVSNSFSHFLLIKQNSEIKNQKEEKLYIEYMFQEVFETDSEQWIFSWENGIRKKPIVACAIPAFLFKAIINAFEFKNLEINSIQPYLISFFNQAFSKCNLRNMNFMIFEGNKCITFQKLEGNLSRIHTSQLQNDWVCDLGKIINRELLLADTEDDALNFKVIVPFEIKIPDSEIFNFITVSPESLFTQYKSSVVSESFA